MIRYSVPVRPKEETNHKAQPAHMVRMSKEYQDRSVYLCIRHADGYRHQSSEIESWLYSTAVRLREVLGRLSSELVNVQENTEREESACPSSR